MTRAQKKKMDVMDNMTDAQLVRLLVAEKLAVEAVVTVKQSNEENKFLNEKLDWAREALEEQMDFREENKQLKEENKQLKEELEDASRHAEIWSSVEAEDSYNELMEENKKLKNTIVSLKSSVDDLRDARDMRDHQINELKEENKKLKNELINQEQVLYKKLYEQEQEYNKTATEYHALLITHKELLDEKINHYKK